jgi:hypothetical protein
MCWLIVPFLIFILGWLRLYYAIPIAAAVVWSFYLFIKKSKPIELPKLNRRTAIIASVSLLGIVLWVFASGIGGYMYQNDDFLYRNAILIDLIKHPWPVIFSPAELKGSEPFAMVYYFGFFLPSALVGKLFGVKAAAAAMWLWSFIGVSCLWLLLITKIKKISILPLLFIALFGGMDIIGCLLYAKPLSFTEHIQWWGKPWQFSAMSTQFFWVFNQSLPAWILLALLMLQKERHSLVFLMGLLLFFAPLPFTGALPFFIIRLLPPLKQLKTGFNAAYFKGIFTPQNLLGGGFIGIISFLFYSTNLAGNNYRFYQFKQGDVLRFVIFTLLEFGILAILLFKENRKNVDYWLIIAVLLFSPFVRVGPMLDFCMRFSIPALFFLLVLSMESCLNLKLSSLIKQRKNWLPLVRSIALIAVLCIGSVTSGLELSRSIVRTAQGENQPKYELGTVLNSRFTLIPNFIGKKEGTIFFDFLANTKP